MVDEVLALLHRIGRFAGLEHFDIADVASAVVVPFVPNLVRIGLFRYGASGKKSIRISWQSSHPTDIPS